MTLRRRTGESLFLRSAAALVVAALVLGQTAFTLFANFPSNYLSKRYANAVYAVMLPYFSQSWSLFAPNPGGGNPHSAFRFAYESGNGNLIVSPWLDGNALFSETSSANPFSRLGLQREIYYGEILIATNGIRAIRRSVAKRSTSPKHPVTTRDLPETLLSVERIYMSLAPNFVPPKFAEHFLVQVAFMDRQPPTFDEVFDRKPARHGAAATLVIPWVRGEYVAPFVSSVST